MRVYKTLCLLVLTAAVTHAQVKSTSLVAAKEIKEFKNLARLCDALPNMKYPDSKNRIRTWKQHNVEGFAAKLDPGIGITIDADEWTLERVKALWADGWGEHDLEHVVVITQAGQRIEFVDMTNANKDSKSPVHVRRGDVVVFLKLPAAKPLHEGGDR